MTSTDPMQPPFAKLGTRALVVLTLINMFNYIAPATRGRIMSIFYCAIPIGSALGYVLGGTVDSHFGWRAAFFVAGVPGLLLALLAFAVPDPPRGMWDGEPRAKPDPIQSKFA